MVFIRVSSEREFSLQSLAVLTRLHSLAIKHNTTLTFFFFFIRKLSTSPLNPSFFVIELTNILYVGISA